MRTLVLGGTPFIGRAIVDALLPDHEVTALNRGTRPLWDARIAHIRADRADPVAMSRALASRPDVVIDVPGAEPAHIAALPAGLSSGDTRHVFVSSAAVYDRARATPPSRESDPASGDPIWGGYGEAKAACERMLRDRWGGRLTVLRPPHVYGPRNHEQREQFLWARILAGQPVFAPGGGGTRVRFCHVGDLAKTVLAAVGAALPPGVCNVAEPASCSFAEYLAILGEKAGRPVHTAPVSDPTVPAREYFPFRQADLTLDVRVAAARWPGRFRPLATGLREAFGWFAEHGSCDEPTPRETAWRAAHVPAPHGAVAELRTALPGDEAAVLSILDEAAAWLKTRGVEQWPARFERAWVADAICDGFTWLARLGGQEAAIITVDWSDPLWDDDADQTAGYVHRFAVRRSAAGLGGPRCDGRPIWPGGTASRCCGWTAPPATTGCALLRGRRVHVPRRGGCSRRAGAAEPERTDHGSQPLRTPARLTPAAPGGRRFPG